MAGAGQPGGQAVELAGRTHPGVGNGGPAKAEPGSLLTAHPPPRPQVNQYPGQRTFKAIGSGGDDFVASMTQCVATVVGTVHQECVNQRLSSGGKYISVTVGPVWVRAHAAAAGSRRVDLNSSKTSPLSPSACWT